MQVIQIGSFAILLKWLLLGIAIILGLIYIRLWLYFSQKGVIDKRLIDLLSNSLFLGFFIWKFSLILFDPSLIMKSPLSLLYFTGGSKGLILAITVTILFFFFKAKKLMIPNVFILQSGFLLSFAVLSGYHILTYIFLNEQQLSHLFLGLYTVLIIVIYLLKQKVLSQNAIFTYLIIFSFFNLLLSFINGNTDNKIFLFSLEQWFFIGLIIVSIFYWDKKSFS